MGGDAEITRLGDTGILQPPLDYQSSCTRPVSERVPHGIRLNTAFYPPNQTSIPTVVNLLAIDFHFAFFFSTSKQSQHNMTRYLSFFIGIFIGLVAQTTYAADLFPKGASRSFQRLDTLEAGATIGGYAIYQGGRDWRTLAIQDQSNNLNIRIGTAQFVSPVGNDFFAEMRVMASLTGAEESGYFSADVCSPAKEHLVVSKKMAGTMDNCLTIDPHAVNIGGREIVVLVLNIRNSQSN